MLKFTSKRREIKKCLLFLRHWYFYYKQKYNSIIEYNDTKGMNDDQNKNKRDINFENKINKINIFFHLLDLLTNKFEAIIIHNKKILFVFKTTKKGFPFLFFCSS
jgi:hypothetical protein